MDTDDAIPLEPCVEEQRLNEQVESTPLCAAVLAAFTGAVGRRWTVGELQRKLAALGFNASRVRLTTALVQLEAHLFDNAFLPWMLIERGKEWFLIPKSVALAAVENAPGLPAGVELDDEEKAILLVVIGHRRRGGVSKTRVREILPGLEPGPVLASLERKGLVYADPERHFDCWRTRSGALLALGLRAHTEIAELRELELYFESGRQKHCDNALQGAAASERVRRRRRLEQAQSLPCPPPPERSTLTETGSVPPCA